MKILEVFRDDGFWRVRSPDGRISVLRDTLQDALVAAQESLRYLPGDDGRGGWQLVLRADVD